MRIAMSFVLGFGFFVFAPLSVSYGQGAAPATKGAPLTGHEGHDHSKHEHEAHGPHDGELLEVGKEEYHVELCVNDEKKQVVVFLMDKEAKGYVSIDASFIAVNAKVKGKPIQFKLKPIPQEKDPKGTASAFGLVGPELIDAIHDKASDARLSLKIGDKPYTVKLKHDHDHDHEGHDHESHDHKKK